MAALVESDLRSGRLPAPSRALVDLAGLLDARLAALATDLAARDIVVQRDRAAELPPPLADAEQLGQVVVNLVQNAMETMPAGGTPAVASARADSIMVTVETTDTGPGVAPEDAERIVHPFHTTTPLGAGLGLAVAREIVQAHGGALTCRSQPGEGCFRVTLPGPEPPRGPEAVPQTSRAEATA